VKAEFYTISGKMFKMATFEYKNRINLNDKPQEFISRMTITNAIMKDDVTVINYSRPVMKKVPDATFNLNLLTSRGYYMKRSIINNEGHQRYPLILFVLAASLAIAAADPLLLPSVQYRALQVSRCRICRPALYQAI